MNLIEIGLAFVEGLALIVSPCILPVLPLVLAASVDGGKRRPYGIILGFVLAFSLFAIAARHIVAALGIDLDIIKNISLMLLAVFGLVLLSAKLSERFSALPRCGQFWQPNCNDARRRFVEWCAHRRHDRTGMDTMRWAHFGCSAGAGHPPAEQYRWLSHHHFVRARRRNTYVAHCLDRQAADKPVGIFYAPCGTGAQDIWRVDPVVGCLHRFRFRCPKALGLERSS